MKNEYNLNFKEFDIDAMIKKKAAKCARAIYRLIPKLNRRKNWALLLQAMQIAYSEKVIFKANITPAY